MTQKARATSPRVNLQGAWYYTITPGNGLIQNQNFVLRRFGEAVRPESYRGLAERVRRHCATT